MSLSGKLVRMSELSGSRYLPAGSRAVLKPGVRVQGCGCSGRVPARGGGGVGPYGVCAGLLGCVGACIPPRGLVPAEDVPETVRVCMSAAGGGVCVGWAVVAAGCVCPCSEWVCFVQGGETRVCGGSGRETPSPRPGCCPRRAPRGRAGRRGGAGRPLPPGPRGAPLATRPVAAAVAGRSAERSGAEPSPVQPSPAQPSPAAERHCGRPAGRAGRGRGSPGPPRPARRRCRSPGGGLPTAPPTPPPSSFPPFGGAREGISPPSRGAVVTRQAAAGGSPRAFPGLFFFFGAGRLGVFAFPRPCRGDGCAQGLVKEFAFQRT